MKRDDATPDVADGRCNSLAPARTAAPSSCSPPPSSSPPARALSCLFALVALSTACGQVEESAPDPDSLFVPDDLGDKAGSRDAPLSEVVAQTFVLQDLEAILVASGTASILNEEGPVTGFFPWDKGLATTDYLNRMKTNHTVWRDHFAAFVLRHISDTSFLEDDGTFPAPGSNITMTMRDGSELFLETGQNRQYYRESGDGEEHHTIAQRTATNGAALMLDAPLSPSFAHRSLQDAVEMLDDAEYGTFKGLAACFLDNPNPGADRWIVDAMVAREGDALNDTGLSVFAPRNSALAPLLASRGISLNCNSNSESAREDLAQIIKSHVLESTVPSSFFGSDLVINTLDGAGVALPGVPPAECDRCGVLALSDEPDIRATTVEGHKVLAVSGAVYGIDSTLSRSARSDPGERGPFETASLSYHVQENGSDYFHHVDYPDWIIPVRGSVHYPTTISGAPRPLIIIVPMRTGPVEIHRRYDYLTEHLASHGFIAATIDVDTVNSSGNTGMADPTRVALLGHHISLWGKFNSDPSMLGSANPFVGKVDVQNIGLIGHSKGGGAIAQYYIDSRDDEAGRPKALFLLAPVSRNDDGLRNVPFGVMLPYCDGDVSGLDGMQYFSSHRYFTSAEHDTAPRYAFLAHGANHNWFAEGMGDDWGPYDAYSKLDEHCSMQVEGNGRLTREQQQSVLLAYSTALFRTHLNGEAGLTGILTGDDVPEAASESVVEIAYQAPLECRRDIHRFYDSDTSHEVNDLGGEVTLSDGLDTFMCSGTFTYCDYYYDSEERPEITPMMRVLWDEPSSATWVENAIPEEFGDFSEFTYLQFRTTIEFELSAPKVDQDLTLELRDRSGAVEGIRVSGVSDALLFKPGTLGSMMPTPRKFSSTVRVPLAQFSVVDLSEIEAVRFVFDQTGDGAIFLSDLAVSRDASPTQGCE